jgi:monothiol glutaredoxin
MFSSKLPSIFKSRVLSQPLRWLTTAAGYSKEDLDGMVKSDSKVVVFMKGTPEAPRCGFSNAVIQILKMHGVKFDAYNVLEDEKLRQGWS